MLSCSLSTDPVICLEVVEIRLSELINAASGLLALKRKGLGLGKGRIVRAHEEK